MTSAHALQQPAAHRAWWREPYVWLVIGGPAVVVVAGLITVAIAVSHQDPVLDRSAAISKPVSEDDAFKLAPAGQARNHATTATLPSKP